MSTPALQNAETDVINVVYKRDGQLRQVNITPLYSQEDDRYLLGFRGPMEYVKGNALDVIKYSFVEVRYWIEATWKSLGLIFRGRFSKDDLSGPVGIAKTVDDVEVTSTTYTEWYDAVYVPSLTTAGAASG